MPDFDLDFDFEGLESFEDFDDSGLVEETPPPPPEPTGLGKFSSYCVFIPPVRTQSRLAQTTKENIQTLLNNYFDKLMANGVECIICIGGMNLDYETYAVPNHIPRLFMYHSKWIGGSKPLPLYERTDAYNLQWEFNLCQNQVSFLVDFIYYELLQEHQQQVAKGEYWLERPTYSNSEYARYFGEDLLWYWLKKRRFITVFNVNKQIKEVKSVFNSNKSGLKCDINLTNTNYYVYNNQIRENLLFK